MNKLNELIYEAQELQVVKDGDLKLPTDKIVVRNYDERYGVKTVLTDWVTEYNLVTKEDLTKEQFLKKLKDAGYELYGEIHQPIKKKLTYSNGDIYYRYIQKTVMY